MDSSVSSGFTNFAICGSDDMYNTLYNLSVFHLISSILKLMGVVYYKWRPIVSRLLYWLKVFVVKVKKQNSTKFVPLNLT